jgi:site-specific recombinase XerD
MNDFFHLVRRYLLEYLPSQRRFSENTVRSYRQGLNLYVSYLRDVMQIPTNRIAFRDCTRDSMLGFLDWLGAERGCGATSVNQRLMVLRSFFKYAGETDCAYAAFGADAAAIPARKAKGRTVDFLTEQALKALLAQPDPRNQTGHRNQFFMILMYDAAARCGELLSLRLRDLRHDAARPVVWLHGKGDKTRVVPMLPETVEHCKRYVQAFHGKSPDDKDGLVFHTKSHGEKTRMSADTVALFMRKYGEAARRLCDEVPECVHPHMLRHTRAMHLYRQGMPLHLLSEFLGHASYETTKVYAYADTEMKRVAIEKADILRDGMPPPEPLWTDDEDLILKLSGLR